MSFLDDGFNRDEAEYNRQNRTNPPEFAPGQSAGFGDDLFSSSMTSTNGGQSFNGGDIFSAPPTGGGDIFSSSPAGGSNIFGNTGGLGGNSFNGGLSQPQQPQKTGDELLFDGIVEFLKKVFTGGKDFLTDIINGFKGLTPLFISRTGYSIVKISVIAIVIGIVSSIFKMRHGLDIAIGGCLSGATGTIAWFMLSEKSRKYSSEYSEDNNTIQTSAQVQPAQPPVQAPSFDSDFGSDDFFSQGSQSDFGSPSAELDEDDDEDYDMGSGDDDDDDLWNQDTLPEVPSTDEALSKLADIPKGMYTRQYLFDAFMQRLPNMKPSFSEMKVIDSDEDMFYATEEKLQEAAGVAGSKEDYLPELLKLEENLFIIRITSSRPTGFKSEQVALELANIYAYQDGEFNPNVYAKADNVGTKCVITIFKGASAMISTKDMINQVKDFFLDSKNMMPVVIGTDQLGKVIYTDFKKVESVLITGMPRSGKSWFVQNVLTQMCGFTSPKDLNIYIADPKGGISDFRSFKLPHVKKFVSGDDKIVDMLRKIVYEEAPRRKKIIGDANCVNIWDFREKYPDVEMPILYVLIDEVVTLAERMEKETKQEFQGLLVTLISQLPASGIRAFLIPHVVKNDIIAKTATDLIPCRISVCGDAQHIESSTGTKEKNFPYRLSNKGDMAVKISVVAPDTKFVHGPALTSSNEENNEFFEYLRRLWLKIEPGAERDSVARTSESEKEIASLAATNLDDDEDLGFTPAPIKETQGTSEVGELFTNSGNRGMSGFNDSAFSGVDDDDDDFFNS